MFPLRQRVLIRGCAAHIAAGLGCGADYEASHGTRLYAPFKGIISIPYFANVTWPFNQGGKWVRLTRPSGDIIEFAHNDSWVVTSGPVQEGALIAYTGNTGRITTGPHCHIQIFRNGLRLDPDSYSWAIDVAAHFQAIWGHPGAPGDILYFTKRLADGSITPDNLDTKLAYWHGVSEHNDADWQKEKQNYLEK